MVSSNRFCVTAQERLFSFVEPWEYPKYQEGIKSRCGAACGGGIILPVVLIGLVPL